MVLRSHLPLPMTGCCHWRLGQICQIPWPKLCNKHEQQRFLVLLTADSTKLASANPPSVESAPVTPVVPALRGEACCERKSGMQRTVRCSTAQSCRQTPNVKAKVYSRISHINPYLHLRVSVNLCQHTWSVVFIPHLILMK